MIDYVDEQIRHGVSLLSEQIKDSSGKLLPRRQIYNRIASDIDSFIDNHKTHPRWIILTGLRGVGKTTLMAQLYVHLNQTLTQGSFDLLYVSLDDVLRRHKGSLNSLLDACELRWGNKLYNLKRPTFLFIDEIQADPEAFKILKPVYDKSQKLFLLCSGSAAVNLYIGASIAGRRAQLERLYPLNFSEYQSLNLKRETDNEIGDQLADIIYSSASAEEVHQGLEKLSDRIKDHQESLEVDSESIDEYIRGGGLPFLLNNPNPQLAAHDVIEQVILRDLPESRFNFRSDSIRKALILASRLANAAETPSLAKLSSEIGISISLLSSILEAFCEAELLIKVPAFGRRNYINSGRPAKYFFMSPTLRVALSNKYGDLATLQTQKGPLLEDLTVLYIYRRLLASHKAQLKFWQGRNQPAADFILEFGDRRIALEIGWGNKSVDQIKATMGKIKCDYGLVISGSKLSLGNDRRVVRIPLKQFILS